MQTNESQQLDAEQSALDIRIDCLFMLTIIEKSLGFFNSRVIMQSS